MRYLLLIILLIPSANALAEELCDSSLFVIEPDHQMPESQFSKESALEALASLSAFVSGTKSPSNWTVIPNYLKIIDGYFLKKKALETKGSYRDNALSVFCQFMKKEAFIYD